MSRPCAAAIRPAPGLILTCWAKFSLAEEAAAQLYRQLATLRYDVPLPQKLSDLEWRGAHSQLKALCQALGDEKLTTRITRWQ